MILSLRVISSFLVFAILSTAAVASVVLPPGAGPLGLSGSTALTEPTLAGVVLVDNLIPVQIRTPSGALLFEGKLQNRVVKSNRTGTLHFYNRIVSSRPGLNGIVASVISKDFSAALSAKADYRIDGLGSINPKFVKRSGGTGAIVEFSFTSGAHPGLFSGQNSKFFFIETLAKRYSLTGKTAIVLKTGQLAIVQTAMPNP